MTDIHFGNTLIIGGTGMLVGASRFLAARSDAITLGARSPIALAQELDGEALNIDWSDPELATPLLQHLPEFDLVVSWLHKDGIWMVEHLESKLKAGGRSIRVHGSASKDPTQMGNRNPGSRQDINRQTVILGWVNEPAGRRWLMNAEISGGVIEAVRNPSKQIIMVGSLDD